MSYLQFTDHIYFVLIITPNNNITYTFYLPQNAFKPFLTKIFFSKDFVAVLDNDTFTTRPKYTSFIFSNIAKSQIPIINC